MTHRSQIKVFSFAIVILITLTTVTFTFAFPDQQSSVRGQAGDLWADVVLGKIDFNQSGPNQVVPFKVFNPGGVIVDRTIRPNRVYVWDGGNSRILGYSSLGVCTNNAAIACTAHSDCAGSSCIFTPNKPADLVLGQPSGYDYSACNNDGNMENYPNRKPASASTLCSLPPWANSPLEAGSFVSMDIDAESNLYVQDYYNNRVLKFNNPFATDTVADEVWGQDDFTGHKCNKTSDDFH